MSIIHLRKRGELASPVSARGGRVRNWRRVWSWHIWLVDLGNRSI